MLVKFLLVLVKKKLLYQETKWFVEIRGLLGMLLISSEPGTAKYNNRLEFSFSNNFTPSGMFEKESE